MRGVCEQSVASTSRLRFVKPCLLRCNIAARPQRLHSLTHLYPTREDLVDLLCLSTAHLLLLQSFLSLHNYFFYWYILRQKSSAAYLLVIIHMKRYLLGMIQQYQNPHDDTFIAVIVRHWLHFLFFVCPSPVSFLTRGKLKCFHTSHVQIPGASVISQTLSLGSLSPLAASATFARLTVRVERKRKLGMPGLIAAVVPNFLVSAFLARKTNWNLSVI